MKKTILIIRIAAVILLGVLAGTAKAQIFIEDYDQVSAPRAPAQDITIFVGTQGGSADQYYTPLGSGTLLLFGLGGVYLLKKRKRED